jgi:hypothetical protein
MTRRSTRKVLFGEARTRLARALAAIGAEECILSIPFADDETEPGVSLSFNLGGTYTVMACDKFTTIAYNTVVLAVYVENLDPNTRTVDVTAMVMTGG